MAALRCRPGQTRSGRVKKYVFSEPLLLARRRKGLLHAYCCRLREERRRLEEVSQALVEGIDDLLKAIEGDIPWKAAWRWGKESSHADMSGLLAEAARANCPVTASFLQKAGAWPFFSGTWGASALHAALEAGHQSMAEVLLKDFGACPYVPDTNDRLPSMSVKEKQEVDQRMFEQERRSLSDLKIREKTASGKRKVHDMLQLQYLLFNSYKRALPRPSCSTASDRDLFLFACRKGLPQLIYLLLKVGDFPVDEVLEDISDTTALHQAASHGKDVCVALLLTQGADPLRSDKYGHTARLLAAMFGHKSTMHLLVGYDGRDPPCRAGTTSKQVRRNFNSYLKCYDKLNSKGEKSLTPNERHDAETVTRKLLQSIDARRLQQQAEDFAIDFQKGEAKLVKEVVMTELKAILDRMADKNAIYRGNLILVGSSGDGSKLYAPDEFDVNLVMSPEMVDVLLEDENTTDAKTRKKISLDSKDRRFVGNRLTEDLYEAMRQDLVKHLLIDKRLSLVPPGLTKTQVGVALALAWQGDQKQEGIEDGEEDEEADEEGKKIKDKRRYQRSETYPLLLIGVDLVPVLKVPWKKGIQQHELKPSDTSNMYISNTDDGSWRCSFAQAEAEVLRTMSPLERRVQLMGKLLLSYLKAEPWMPHHRKTFCTWFVMRAWRIPLPNGFCLKNAILWWLNEKKQEEVGKDAWQEEGKDEEKKEHRRNAKAMREEEDPVKILSYLFRSMCDKPEDRREHLHAGKTPAFFGGECESEKLGYGAPFIVQYLEEFLDEEKGMKGKGKGRKYKDRIKREWKLETRGGARRKETIEKKK